MNRMRARDAVRRAAGPHRQVQPLLCGCGLISRRISPSIDQICVPSRSDSTLRGELPTARCGPRITFASSKQTDIASRASSSRIATFLNRLSKKVPRVLSCRLARRDNGCFKHFINQLKLCSLPRTVAINWGLRSSDRRRRSAACIRILHVTPVDRSTSPCLSILRNHHHDPFCRHRRSGRRHCSACVFAGRGRRWPRHRKEDACRPASVRARRDRRGTRGPVRGH
jgi:hypothetical protein